jgi:hypothetical protein
MGDALRSGLARYIECRVLTAADSIRIRPTVTVTSASRLAPGVRVAKPIRTFLCQNLDGHCARSGNERRVNRCNPIADRLYDFPLTLHQFWIYWAGLLQIFVWAKGFTEHISVLVIYVMNESGSVLESHQLLPNSNGINCGRNEEGERASQSGIGKNVLEPQTERHEERRQ